MKGHSARKPVELESYSSIFVFIYFFTSHLGQSIFILPKLISRTGLLLSTLLLTCIAAVNFITGTHVIEAMGIANACYRLETRRRKSETKELDPLLSDLQNMKAVKDKSLMEEEQTPLVRSSDHEDEEDVPSVDDESRLSPEDYEINERFEMGEMANMFFAPIGIILYYIVMCFYITGSLASILIVVVKTLVVLVCVDSSTHPNTVDVVNVTNNTEHVSYTSGRYVANSICFGEIIQQETYYIMLSIIALLTSPWVFFKFTTSKYLQVLTNTMKTIAFGFMIGICIAMLAMGQRANPPPPLAGFSALPALFGIATYSFKNQYWLPGVITPMRQKHRILLMIFAIMFIILAFYMLTSFTAMFWLSFDELQDLYTLNFFIPFSTSYPLGKKVLSVIGYYVVAYPVLALTPILPVESIIFRENLKALTSLLFKEKWMEIKLLMFTVDHILLPMVVIILPLAIAFATTNVAILLSISGGVFGVWIQYIISTALLFAGKCFLMKKYKGKYENKYKSPFNHIFFLFFIIVCTAVSAILVIVGHILSFI